MIAVQRSGCAALKAVLSHLDQIFQVEPPQALGALPVLAGLLGKHLCEPLRVCRQQASLGDHHCHLTALEDVEILVILHQPVDLCKVRPTLTLDIMKDSSMKV